MEKALSVIIVTDKIKKDNWAAEDIIAEFGELVTSSRIRQDDRVVCNLKDISPAFLLGKGKIDEIRRLSEELNVDVVVFSENLSGTQQKNIEGALGIKTIDRTQLILDIFARRARSGEGKIQVELAQLEYLMPRLSGKGILLSRLGGGIGTRGPGEQKLEVDRRRIAARINKLKKELSAIAKQRTMRRKKRERFSMLTIAIIGYTNAGKSTLLNVLTGSDILVDNMLFSTLDPTIRKYTLPTNQNVLFIDTVGFIYKLPHNLIDAFKATLEEVAEADILLHLLDMSHPKIREQNEATYKVLEELDIKGKPIITVLNKSDRVEDPATRKRLLKYFTDAINISALRRDNIDELIDRITLHLGSLTTFIKVKIPMDDMKSVHLIYKLGKVVKRVDEGASIYIEAQVPQRVMQKLNLYQQI
ncbi:MAG: GTPase HflX [Candidatus Omnitrophica bacterium]|nr:GTPase HflX [Candidatus Omnitrophota bacterium]